jgi:hypothetical protein
MDDNTTPQQPTTPEPAQVQSPPEAQPQPVIDPTQQVSPTPAKQSEAPTPAHIMGKPPRLLMHRVFLIILIALVVLFGIAYIGVYYLLNQQLNKLTHANKQTQTIPTQIPSPTILPSPTAIPPETSISPSSSPSSSQQQVACTLEAKQCPDGSFVGRQGPNCEFAACPN